MKQSKTRSRICWLTRLLLLTAAADQAEDFWDDEDFKMIDAASLSKEELELKFSSLAIMKSLTARYFY